MDPELRSTLDAYARLLRGRFGGRLLGLRLFGSRARGDAHEGSDADVAVVIEGLTDDERAEAIDLAFDAWRLGRRGPLLSPLVWSREEQAEQRRRGRRLALDIESEGIPL